MSKSKFTGPFRKVTGLRGKTVYIGRGLHMMHFNIDASKVEQLIREKQGKVYSVVSEQEYFDQNKRLRSKHLFLKDLTGYSRERYEDLVKGLSPEDKKALLGEESEHDFAFSIDYVYNLVKMIV
jgi:hypothetical protein